MADAGLRIMDALNAESVADPVWAVGATDSTEAQRRADYAEQARGGRWVTDITGRHAILRDAQGRSVLAGSNISRVRLKGVPVVGFVMAQADQVQPLGDTPVGRAERIALEDRPIDVAPVTARPLAVETQQQPSEPGSHAAKNQAGSEPPRPINIYIEGLKMPGIGGSIEAFKNEEDEGAKYFYQSQTEEILEFIRSLPPGTKINLIGHSYGADTAAVVAARSERRIDKLVTIDPVSWFGAGSWFGPSYADVKRNTNWWHNVTSAPPRVGIEQSIPKDDFLAGIGGPHNDHPEDFADSFISVGTHHREFHAMMAAEVNGMSGNRAVLPIDHPLLKGK